MKLQSDRFGAALCLALLLCHTGVAHASFREAAVQFLLVPMDIRSRALGEAGVSLPDIGFALDVNPALLLQAEHVTAGYGQGDWIPGWVDDLAFRAAYASIGPGLITGDSGLRLAFGMGYKLFDRGVQTRVDEFGNVLGEFETSEWAATLGGAVGLGNLLSLGASMKIINSNLAEQGAGAEQGQGDATGWAVDLGAHVSGVLPQATLGRSDNLFPNSTTWNRLLVPRNPGFSFGLAVQNLGPNFDYVGSQSEPLPRVLRFGASYRVIDTDLLGILGTGEYVQSLVSSDDWFESGGYTLNWGVEMGVLRILDFRWGQVHVTDLGAEAEDAQNNQTYGLGIGVERIRVDYSHIETKWPLPDEMDYWSVSVRW